MNHAKLKRFEHYKVTPPVLRRRPDGVEEVVDWEWFLKDGPEGTFTLLGRNEGGGAWAPSIEAGDIHSYQHRHLLLRGQLPLFDGGQGFEFRPFSADCRKEIEPLLDRICELEVSLAAQHG